MTSAIKIFYAVLNGLRDNNIAFTDLRKLLESLGFQYRINGSHYIYWREGIEEIINIQEDNSKAKSYQVKQVRKIITKYNLSI
ncbi:MAG: type II toxin-antitoxin system HicA family toxin [Synergistaceae bacterium]|nr:type II toxin-antitoxin system HicA family toxin [Synergistaceae bacterium]